MGGRKVCVKSAAVLAYASMDGADINVNTAAGLEYVLTEGKKLGVSNVEDPRSALMEE